MGGWSIVCCAHCCSPPCFSSATPFPKDISCFLIGLNRAPGCLHKRKGYNRFPEGLDFAVKKATGTLNVRGIPVVFPDKPQRAQRKPQ